MPDYPQINPEVGILARLAALEERVAALENTVLNNKEKSSVPEYFCNNCFIIYKIQKSDTIFLDCRYCGKNLDSKSIKPLEMYRKTWL